MRDHAANGPVENLGRGAVVEGAGFLGVYNVAFVEKVMVPQLHSYMSAIHRGAYVMMMTLLRKKLPEMFISSHRTTTIFWPLSICFEIIEASRPRRWPLPSMTMGVEEKVDMVGLASVFCVEYSGSFYECEGPTCGIRPAQVAVCVQRSFG